jgi:AcrR family transcriptional regulator
MYHLGSMRMELGERTETGDGRRSAPPPAFRRPRREDAIALARQAFLQGERVDMQILAARLGVARTTLYRWVGGREALLEEVFGAVVVELFAPIEQRAEGEGAERLLSVLEAILEVSAGFEPARRFAAREPELAIRLLLGEGGVVHRRATETILRLLGEPAEPVRAKQVRELCDVIVQVATALLWVTYAIGEQPRIDRARRVAASLLDSARAEGVI